MEKIVISGTKEELIAAMQEKGYHMEGFNEEAIAAKYFYAYKKNYKGADYFSIRKKDGMYTIKQY